MPRAHTSLFGFRVLNQPAIEQTYTHCQNLCHCHDNLIPAAHLADHFHIFDTVHGTGLLRKEFLH